MDTATSRSVNASDAGLIVQGVLILLSAIVGALALSFNHVSNKRHVLFDDIVVVYIHMYICLIGYPYTTYCT
jgi:hypothetical protein